MKLTIDSIPSTVEDLTATFVHVKDRLWVTNCVPRRVSDDNEIFAKFVWINNAKHILCDQVQLIACRNNTLACLAKLEL